MPEDFDPYATRKFSRAEISAAEQKEKRTMIRYPEYLPQLGQQKPSMIGDLPGLIDEIEKQLHKGVIAYLNEDGTYTVGRIGELRDVPKDDSSYAYWADYHTLQEKWTKHMLLSNFDENQREAATNTLRSTLERRGIILGNVPDIQTNTGDELVLTEQIINLLPDAYFSHGTLRRIDLDGDPNLSINVMREQVGNFDPENFIASTDPTMLAMGYKFTFAGILLHELGHPIEQALLKSENAALIKTAFGVIKDYDAFMNTDLGRAHRIDLDADVRHDIQIQSANEFLAETFMMYVSQGDRLREHIRAFPVDSEVSNAWLDIYKHIRDALGKVEYSNDAEQTA